MNNFATFYTQAVKDKLRKVKRGKYRGQLNNIKPNGALRLPGPAYFAAPGKSDAPSASTYKVS